MIVFPPCKINLGLHILRKRNDGFHDISTIFYPVPLYDALELIRTDDTSLPVLTQTGQVLDLPPEKNIVYKAWELIRKDFPELGPVRFHLHKHIPSGAGLGGGSADGAFALRLINQVFHLALSQETLIRYALQLGSDCPFFILDQPAIGEGRGEDLKPISLDLSSYQLVLVNPGIHVNTGWAFSQIKPEEYRAKSLTEIIRLPVEEWQEQLTNDFEQPVFMHYPAIQQIRDDLYEAGALYAAMSGSGSTVFGLFRESCELHFPSTYFVRWLSA